MPQLVPAAWRVPVFELLLHGLRGHLAGALRQLDAGVLAEAEGRGIARERVDRQAVADGISATIAAGANAITYTPPSPAVLFKEMMEKYRE